MHFLLLPLISLVAQQTGDSARIATAARAAIAPKIDGRDTDSVWRQAPRIDGFLEQSPSEGAPPRARTVAQVAYDAENLYVFVRAYDAHPDSIIARLARRDGENTSDRIGVYIDSYFDRRTAYHLIVNAAGVKGDAFWFDDVRQDLAWDGIWDVATTIDSLGWTAEYRVPLSQLRFPSGASHTFGLAIRRIVARYGDLSGWPLIRPSRQGVVSQFGELRGIETPGEPHPKELTPYALTRAASGPGSTGQGSMSLGADARIGISSSATMLLAVNPDFGQVEADPAVLNLTAFETFYPERRPLFVEGQGLFAFPLSRVNPTSDALFYSRRIGRSPQLRGLYGDPDAPLDTRLQAAAKLTGRSRNGFSLGVLAAETEPVRSRSVAAQLPDSTVTIEPRTSYGAARIAKEVAAGRSGLALMVTGVRRELDESTRDLLREYAVTAGFDARHRFARDRYIVMMFGATSLVTGTPASMILTQRSSPHNFQRPGGGTALDSTATRLSGTIGELALSKVQGTLQYGTGYRRISPAFESNDIGFLGRADWQSATVWANYNSARATAFYQSAGVFTYVYNEWTADGLPTERVASISALIAFRSQWRIGPVVTIGQWPGSFCTVCARGGPAVRRDLRSAVGIVIEGDPRRTISPRLDARWFRDEQGATQTFRVTSGVDLRPWRGLLWSTGVTSTVNHDDAQWYRNRTTSGGTESLFAHLDQRTVGLTNRFNVTITPRFSFEWYAEPFLSAGPFSNIRALTDPRAQDRRQRYVAVQDSALTANPGGVRFLRLRSNAVARWEYRPGSVAFLVWNHGRDVSDATGQSFELGAETSALFRQPPSNVLLLKVSYTWLR